MLEDQVFIGSDTEECLRAAIDCVQSAIQNLNYLDDTNNQKIMLLQVLEQILDKYLLLVQAERENLLDNFEYNNTILLDPDNGDEVILCNSCNHPINHCLCRLWGLDSNDND